MSMMALDLRSDWRTVEQPKAAPQPWRPLLISLTTAFAVAGLLLLRHPMGEAAQTGDVPESPPPPAPAVVLEAPPPPPPVAVAAPPAPAPLASVTTASIAPVAKKKKHAVSHDDPARRALRDLQRAQLVRATKE